MNLLGNKKKQCYVKMTGIAVVLGALGTIPKGLVKGTGKLGNKRTRLQHY